MTTTINASTTAGLVNTADTSGVLALQTAGTTAVTVDASQNVGIGTTSPNARLEIYVQRTSSTNATAIVLNDNVTGGQTNGVYKSIQSRSNNGASVSEIRFLETDGTNNNTAIAFATAGVAGGITERVRILNTGAIVCLAGGNTAATGTGIAFPSSQTASSDANTLDDYEEGTWTPVMSGSTTAGTGTYNGQAGSYVKIGSVVYYTLDLSWTNHTGTGNMNLSGLPFTSNGTYCAGACRAASGLALAASHYIQAFVNVNATTFSWEQFPVGGGFQSAIPMDTSGAIMITGFYRV